MKEFIGIPYVGNGRELKGCDCWGLVCLYYKKEYNITLESMETMYYDVNDIPLMSGVLEYQKKKWNKTDKPQKGDVVVFKIKNMPVHCGIYIGNNKFLHNFYGSNSCIERLDGIRWGKRFEGYYRYI